MSSEPPIIITNGSITIEFNESTFKKGSGKFSHPKKKIRRVEIVGDTINLSEDIPSGAKLTIKVFYSSE